MGEIVERLQQALARGEGESVEFKRSFDEQARQTLSAFANTSGGDLWVGVADDRVVVGTDVGPESLRDWANQIAQALGVHARMERATLDGKTVVLIAVPESAAKPVYYRGRAYVRFGSTTRVAGDQEITHWVLDRTGQTWDVLPEPRARWDDLDPAAIARFRRLCQEQGRRTIPADEPDEMVLEKLGLATTGGLTRAAVLLFGREPQRFYSSAFVRIGRFRSTIDVVDDRPIYGTVFDQIEGAMVYFREHLETRYEFRGAPAREVIWEYPLEALREAVVNAVCHRDYLDTAHTQVRWYDDQLVFMTPGGLPSPLRPEDLKRPHPSRPRNKKLAQALFDVGWIEQWGSGFEKMTRACREAGLPEPEWEERAGAFWLAFRKDVLTEAYLRGLGLNERQVKAVLWAKGTGEISNRAYRELTGLSDEGARRDLSELVAKGVLRSEGRGRSARYVLPGFGD